MDCIKKQFETLGINHQSDITVEEGTPLQRHPNHKHERDDRHHNLFLNGKPEGRSKFQHRDLRHGEHHHLCHPHRNPHRYRRSQLPNDTEMAPEEGNSPSHPHHQRRPPQKNHRYSGSKVDSEQYYHNPFYYRTHRNRANHLKNGGDTSGGFSFNHEALDNSEILYENIDDPIVSDSDIPQFHIPRRKDKKKEEDNYPLYHQTYLHPHHRDPPRGRDRRPRPNTNNPWPHPMPHPMPPPPLVPQTAALSSSTTSSQQKPSRRKEPVTRRFSATTSTGSPHLPRSRPIPLHYVPGHEPPNSELDTTTSSPPPPPQGRRRRLSPPLFPLPAPTTTVDGGSVLMAGRGEKRSSGLKRGDRKDYNDKIRDQTSGGPLASDSPSPIRSFVPDGYEEGGSDELLPPEPTEINGTELSLSVRKRNGGGSGEGDGSLIYDGGSVGYDEEGYEGYGYEYVGPDYDGEEVIVVGGRGKGHEELWSPGWEVSSVRTFSDGGGGKRDDEEEGTSELIVGGSGRGRGFFDYARARARRKGERVRGATGHQVSGLGDDDGEPYHFGRGGFETAGRGGGWETEPEQYLFDDEDFGGDVPRGWLPGRIERVDYEHGEDERARDKRKYRRKKHSDSNRTSTPPALPNGPAPPSIAGPLSTIRAPRTPSEVAGCALGTAAVGLCATGVKKVVSQAIKWEVEKQVQERLWEERMERRRRRARKREEKEKKWRERDRLEREAIVAGRASGRPGFARRLSDKVPQRFKRAMSGPSGPSDLSKANERRDKDWPFRDDAVEMESSDPIGEGFRVEDGGLSPKLRRGWRRGWSRSRTPEPRRPFPRWSRPPEEPWRRGGGSGFHDSPR